MITYLGFGDYMATPRAHFAFLTLYNFCLKLIFLLKEGFLPLIVFTCLINSIFNCCANSSKMLEQGL